MTKNCKTTQVRATDSNGVPLNYQVSKEVCEVSEPTTCTKGDVNDLKYMICGKLYDWTILPPLFRGFSDLSARWNYQTTTDKFGKEIYLSIGTYSPYNNYMSETAYVTGPGTIVFPVFEVEGMWTCYDSITFHFNENGNIRQHKLCSKNINTLPKNINTLPKLSIPAGKHRIAFNSDYSVTKKGVSMVFLREGEE